MKAPTHELMYRDTGCALAPRCLTCPLPRCIEEVAAAEVRAGRDRALRRLARSGWTTARLTERFGLTASQVRRIR